MTGVQSSVLSLLSLSLLAVIQLLMLRIHVSNLDLEYFGSPGHDGSKDS